MPNPARHRILTLRLTPEENAQLESVCGPELTDKHEYIHAAIRAAVQLDRETHGFSKEDIREMELEEIAKEIANG